MKKRPPVPYRFITGLDPVAQREIERDFASVTDTPYNTGFSQFVACSDAQDWEKEAADLVLTGTDDQTLLNALIQTFPGANIVMSSGHVYPTGQIETRGSNGASIVRIYCKGMGFASEGDFPDGSMEPGSFTQWSFATGSYPSQEFIDPSDTGIGLFAGGSNFTLWDCIVDGTAIDGETRAAFSLAGTSSNVRRVVVNNCEFLIVGGNGQQISEPYFEDVRMDNTGAFS